MTEKPEKEGARILVGKFDGTGETKIARNRQKWCSHRRFALDAEAREVRCQGCGKLLDPFEILFEYATEERSFENWRQSVIDQGKKLAELRAEEKRIKARTKNASRKDAKAAVEAERRKWIVALERALSRVRGIEEAAKTLRRLLDDPSLPKRRPRKRVDSVVHTSDGSFEVSEWVERE